MSLYWLLWLVVGFGVPETIAIVSKHYNNTLSEVTWRWFDVLPGQTIWQWRVAHVILAAFMVWLFVHIVLGFWR